MNNDSELLRLYAEQGSEAAFRELVQRHLPTVFAAALRRVGGDAHLAEEVAQLVFVDLARKAKPLGRRDSIMGWLFVAARFSAAKAVRRDRSRRQLEEQMMREASLPDTEKDWSELRPLLDQAVQELGEREREAVLLHFYGQRTYRDIGVMLRLTENGARMRVERALEKLRQALGRRGVTSAAAALTGALASQAAATVPSGFGVAVASTALAAATAAPAASVPLLLMTITKTQLTVALAAVVAGTTFLGIRLEGEIATLQRQVSAAATASAASAAQGRALKERLASQASVVTLLRTQLQAAKSGSTAPAAKTQSEVVVIHIADVRRAHPEYAALEARESGRATLHSYAKGMALLNLAPDQLDKLHELLLEREQAAEDAAVAASAAGLDNDSDTAKQAVNEARRAVTQAIDNLIGAATADKLEALRTNVSSGSPTEDALADMDVAGIPATSDQAVTLAQLIHDTNDKAKNPAAAAAGSYGVADPTTWLSPSNEQVLNQAANILTPAQLSLLSKALSDSNQMNAIMSEYRKPTQSMMIVP